MGTQAFSLNCVLQIVTFLMHPGFPTRAEVLQLSFGVNITVTVNLCDFSTFEVQMLRVGLTNQVLCILIYRPLGPNGGF